MRALVILLLFALLAAPSVAASQVDWRPWGSAAFAAARAEDKPLYLYLEAVWCHWCHVMQRETLSDPAVAEVLNEKFIPVRVDHDAQPALANRYRAWGWPAQVWYTPAGEELLKRSGYIAPQDFRKLLLRIAENPQDLPAAPPAVDPPQPGSPYLSAKLESLLQRHHRDAYDPEYGGLDLMKKFLDADSVEYAMLLARRGNEAAAQRARKTLDAALKLIDPVWGGVYQYSVHGVWDNPHYEKLMRSQARYLRIYALAWLQFEDPDYRAGAYAVREYLATFLSGPQGAFYVSQSADLVPGQKAHDYFDLDDAGRRARGMPAIDKHRYAAANGKAIEGLAMLYQATGDAQSLRMARRAANWVLAHRALTGGGFAHGADDTGGPYLADSLYMARAFLALHRATGERAWLQHATAAADFIINKFSRPGAGFNGSVAAAGPLAPVPTIDENIDATRFFNLLYHYTGAPEYRAAAEHGMRYLATEQVATDRIVDSGILLADIELSQPPVHLTVVGDNASETAQALYRAALETPGWYKRIEWWDRSAGPLPRSDVQYPDFGRPAGYLCTDNRCSLPQFSASDLRALIASRVGRD